MELEDDGPDAQMTVADREWNKLSNDFMTAGYREGITAGKESALQEGFDDGFASVGAPLGRQVGMLRGAANAALALCVRRRGQGGSDLEAELRDIIRCLARVKLSTLGPPDMQAIEHAKTHGADHAPDVGDVEVSAQARMDGLEDALEALSTTSPAQTLADPAARSAAAMEDLARIGERLEAARRALGI
ncbi:hypothetical protein FRC08_011347 [Ceratobasidium sp. 394]|nr:hypothetical protein FRC08_011347 [Ceratobasidium sp. 394]